MPLPKSNRTPRRRAAITSGNRMPSSSRMPFGAGAYICVTMSPRLSNARIARIGDTECRAHAIKSCRRYLFVFFADRAIPPTNNGSEQAAAPLRHLPQGDKLLPLTMGRKSLRRYQVRDRNRAATNHRGAPSHPPHLDRHAVTRPGHAPIRVSNYLTRARAKALPWRRDFDRLNG
jgi:hypothetical protein